MTFGIAFYDSDGRCLKLPGSWRILLSADGRHQLVGDGMAIDLPDSLFVLDPRLTPDQLDEIERQVEATNK